MFKFDGSTITALLVDAGTGSTNASSIIDTPFGVIWTCYTSTVGNEYYIYDGSTVQLLADMNPGSANGPTGAHVATASKLYFAGEATSSKGRELYQYDGTAISLVADVWPDFKDSRPELLMAHNDTVYFVAEYWNQDYLYRYDGSNLTQVIKLPS